MASVIRVKRSTGIIAPSTLNYGELAYTVGLGSYANGGGRLYVGDLFESPIVIGGKYYTDLLSNAPGSVAGQSNPTSPSNGFVPILDQNRKVDEWNVDYLTLDGNEISTVNEDIILNPGGSSEVIVPSNTNLSFGSTSESSIKYDSITSNLVEVQGVGWKFNSGVPVKIQDTTQSTGIGTGALVVSGGVGIGSNLTIGGDIVSSSQAINLLNSTVTRANILGSASNIIFGATTGVTTIRNGITSFSNSSNTSYVAIAATTSALSESTGALRVAGGVGIGSDLYIGGKLFIAGALSFGSGISTFQGSVDINQDLKVLGNTTLGNSASDSIYVTGITTVTGPIYQTGNFNNSGGAQFDSIGISSNIISSRIGKIYIDPYADGLSNEGTVVIKGDLQVDGTTTSINSNEVTIDDAILNLGNVTLIRTVMNTVALGNASISLDSVIGINTSDIVSGSPSLSPTGITTITSVDYNNKIIYISNTAVGGISTGTQLTITTAYDTNTDRGISFNYNTSFGVANNKTGFFGYHDLTGNWTYIPNATITNSVASGIKGTLDVGALLLDWQVSGISTRGSAYFNSTGQLVSTGTPESTFISNSNYILTTDETNTPIWTDTLDGGIF